MRRYLTVLLVEDVLGRLKAYVRLAGRVCKGPEGGAALKGFSKRPCFSWFSSSLAYAFLFFFQTGLLVCRVGEAPSLCHAEEEQ